MEAAYRKRPGGLVRVGPAEPSRSVVHWCTQPEMGPPSADSYQLACPGPGPNSNEPDPPITDGQRMGERQAQRSRILHHHQRPAVHSGAQPGSGRVRRSNSASIRATSRPRSIRAPRGRWRMTSSKSSRASSISKPGCQTSDAFSNRPGCLNTRSKRDNASKTRSGRPSRSSSTRRTAARVRAETPRIRCTITCLRGRHRSVRTAFGRLRGIALSGQHHADILPRAGPMDRTE